MKASFLATLILFLSLGPLWAGSVHVGMLENFGKVENRREKLMPPPTPRQEATSAPLQEEPANASSRREDTDDVHTPINNPHPLAGRKAAVEAATRVGEAYNSGLKGTTSSIVMSGVPGGQRTGGPTSIEFAIAPLEGDKPAYQKAIFVKSERQGAYEVALPPGTYWIGPKAKALDPVQYRPGAFVFQEREAIVKEGVFTQLDLVEVGYAP